MNESNGKLELDNWIQIWIAYVINQTQVLFNVIQRLLNLEGYAWWFQWINACQFHRRVMKVATHTDVC